jgi:fructosamine-3-kinase
VRLPAAACSPTCAASSSLAADWGEAVGRALGSAVADSRAVSGGDINEARELTLADGRVVFLKTNGRADPTMFPAEARGLAWLEEAGALRVPRVLAVSGEQGPAFLVLEAIRAGRRRADFDDQLGRGLAALHGHGAAGFGLDHDNFIGRLPQSNAPLAEPGWAAFYRARRLEPQLRRAVDAGLATPGLRRSCDRLFTVLEERVGPPEPPARLHGDLWGGNLLVDETGSPCLIDPAVHGGHREVDLAMMRLFGGFSTRVFAAYHEAAPLAEGADERVPLYQLYFLLVHVNQFGGSYLGSAERAAAAMA